MVVEENLKNKQQGDDDAPADDSSGTPAPAVPEARDEPPPVPDGKRRLRIAVAGCVHGEIDKVCDYGSIRYRSLAQVYATMAELEKGGGGAFDLLICCGDYQVSWCGTAGVLEGGLCIFDSPRKFISFEKGMNFRGDAQLRRPVMDARARQVQED